VSAAAEVWGGGLELGVIEVLCDSSAYAQHADQVRALKSERLDEGFKFKNKIKKGTRNILGYDCFSTGFQDAGSNKISIETKNTNRSILARGKMVPRVSSPL
jgi:hypothetical protein